MTVLVNTKYDFGNARRLTNLAAAAANGEPVVFEQMNALIQGLSWKDNARVASTVNVTISSPGTTVDAITMVSGDRTLLKNQTATIENGLYIWNGSATPMTRASDADTFDKLESAVVSVDEGTSNAGTTWRQTQVNGVIGTNSPAFVSFGTSAAVASISTAGIIQLATQTEVDTGTDNAKAVTPLTLTTFAGRAKRFPATFGDGSATSYVITHNLNTLDVQVYVYENGGSKRQVLVEIQHTSVNSVTIVADVAPATNAYRAVVIA